MLFRLGENETVTDIVLLRKEHLQFLQDVKAIPFRFTFGVSTCGSGSRYR